MKILFYSSQAYDIEAFNKANENYNFDLTFVNERINPYNANRARGFDAICSFVNDTINKDIIDILVSNGIKIILLRCAGFNSIDIEYAKSKNITVARVPAYSPNAVAEHAVALLQTLNRKIHKAYNRIKEGNFTLNGLTGFDLNQKKVGIIGFGNIGKVFANIMLGFNCNVLAYDPFISEEDKANSKITFTSLDNVFNQSDIISLHCPLNSKTNYIINDQSFEKMKNNVFLVNTSRGKLINTKAAITALKSGKLGGLAIDVYEEEEQLFFKDSSNSIIEDDTFERLTTFPNVIITAHQAFLTHEALAGISNTTLLNAFNLFNNKNCTNTL